jgi:hypothetical protein
MNNGPNKKRLLMNAQKESLKNLLLESKEVIQEATTMLERNGVKYQLGEWLTVKRYCERFGIPNTQTVTNWINRGIISEENVITLPELNNVRLIRAIPYFEG